MKSIYLLVLALAISVASCRVKEGEPGPAGQSALKQQGNVSGKIAYTDAGGNDTSTSFSFEYFSSLNNNKFYYQKIGSNTYYEFDLERRDLQDNNCYIDLNANGYGVDDAEDDPSYSYMHFSFLKVIDGNLYEFSNNTGVDITNLTLDPATGRLTYDFSGTVYSGSSEATITGTVDVILNRSSSSTSPK